VNQKCRQNKLHHARITLIADKKLARSRTTEENKMSKGKIFDLVALILVIVGGLNWGLVGAFGFNLVTTIFGDGSTISNVVYGLVGVGALYLAATSTKLLKK
jgi:hypothetical protein